MPTTVASDGGQGREAVCVFLLYWGVFPRHYGCQGRKCNIRIQIGTEPAASHRHPPPTRSIPKKSMMNSNPRVKFQWGREILSEKIIESLGGDKAINNKTDFFPPRRILLCWLHWKWNSQRESFMGMGLVINSSWMFCQNGEKFRWDREGEAWGQWLLHAV